MIFNKKNEYGTNKSMFIKNRNRVSTHTPKNKNNLINPLKFSIEIDLDSNIMYSFFARNGTGKSTISNYIYETLYRKKPLKGTKRITYFGEDVRYDFNTPKNKQPNIKNNNSFVYSICDRMNLNTEYILPNDALELLDKYSFCKNISYNIYNIDEKKIQEANHIISIHFKGIYLSHEIPVFNNRDYDFGHNAYYISLLALYIEMLCSYFKFSVSDILLELKKRKACDIFSHEVINNNDVIFINKLINNISFLEENHFILDIYLETYSFVYDDKLELFKNSIDDFNSKIEEKFKIVRQEFLKYFPEVFKDIILVKIYNSSIGSYIYTLEVIDQFDNEFLLDKFINDIGSESEKKLIKLFITFIEIKILYNENMIIIADDILDSFDNLNSINLLNILSFMVKKDKINFISFTHDYELFKLINNSFQISQKNIFLLSKDILSGNVTAINFPIRNNFYKDYLVNKRTNNIYEQILLIISAIPYYRSIIEISEGENSINYLNATYLMHYKNNISLEVANLFNEFIFKDFVFLKNDSCKDNIMKYLNKNNDYVLLLNEIYEEIIIDPVIDINLIEYRLFMAIYARLLIESWIIKFLEKHDPSFNLNNIDKNQTGFLLSRFNYILDNKDEDLTHIKNAFENLNQYIPSYIHFGQNDISYMININIQSFLNCIENVRNLLRKNTAL